MSVTNLSKEELGTSETPDKTIQSIIGFTSKIEDPLVPDVDNSSGRWKKPEDLDSCCTIL